MGVCVQCTTASKLPDGRVVVNWTDGTQDEYPSVAAYQNACFAMDSDPGRAKLWLGARWLRNDPTLADPAGQVNGKTCTVNSGASEVIQIA